MKIALINSNLISTGSGRYAFSLHTELRKLIKIDHIFFNYKNKKIERINDYRERIYKSINILIDFKYFFYFRTQKKIPKYDIYHITTQNLSFLKLKPKIVTCLDIIHNVYPDKFYYFLFSKYLYSKLKNAEFIITISKSTKKDLMQYYSIQEEKIEVIYPGIDNKKFHVNINSQTLRKKYNLSNQKIILHVSSETPRKNFLFLIKAFHILKNRYNSRNTKLIKAGKYQYYRDREKTLKLIKKLNLEKDVIILDYISDLDLVKLYNISDLFVFPSLYEGFGLPPLEAMACGCPVITSNVSSLPEVVSNAGLMVNPFNVEELANKIYVVLTNDELRQKMIKDGLKRAKMFSWEKTATKTLQIYNKVYNSYENSKR